MAFKLYDFKDPELDEQIRLICDLLYNKRETYPNQLGGVSTLGLRPDIYGIFHGLLIQAGYNTLQLIGTTVSSLGLLQSTTRHNLFHMPMASLETAVTLDNIAYIFGSQSANADELPSLLKSGWNPTLEWHVRFSPTASDVAACELYAIMGNATAGSVVDPKTNTNHTFIGFRCDIGAGDTTWKISKRQTAGGAITDLVTTAITVAADYQYTLELQLARNGADSVIPSWRIRTGIVSAAGVLTGYTDTGLQVLSATGFDESLPMYIMLIIKNKTAGTSRIIYFKHLYAQVSTPIDYP